MKKHVSLSCPKVSHSSKCNGIFEEFPKLYLQMWKPHLIENAFKNSSFWMKAPLKRPFAQQTLNKHSVLFRV